MSAKNAHLILYTGETIFPFAEQMISLSQSYFLVSQRTFLLKQLNHQYFCRKWENMIFPFYFKERVHDLSSS